MALHESFQTELMKELEKEYPNVVSLHQEIWLHAAELYMDDVDEPAIRSEEVKFLEYAYSIIKKRGEDLHLYSKDELFQVHVMLVSSIHLNREDLIEKSGLSRAFVSKVEAELEKLGYSFI